MLEEKSKWWKVLQSVSVLSVYEYVLSIFICRSCRFYFVPEFKFWGKRIHTDEWRCWFIVSHYWLCCGLQQWLVTSSREPVGDNSVEFRLSLELAMSQHKLIGESLAATKHVSYTTFSFKLPKERKEVYNEAPRKGLLKVAFWSLSLSQVRGIPSFCIPSMVPYVVFLACVSYTYCV